MHVSWLTALLAMVAMVTGRDPTEEQLRQAVTMATKELGNAHCVRKDNKVVCEKEPRQAKVVSETLSKSQRHFAAMHAATPRTIKLSQSAVMLEKVAKNLMDSDEQFTLERLGQVASDTITGLCEKTVECQILLIDGVEFRTADGCGNNRENPTWGSPNQCLKRLLPPQYGNRHSAPRTNGQNGTPLPNARHVSLVMQEDLRKSNHETTHLLMQFGQFMSHEITLTAEAELKNHAKCSCGSKKFECFNVPIPAKDPDFGKRSCLEFTRSAACPNQKCRMGPRQHFYQVTAFVDASNVYGHTKEAMDALREMSEEAAEFQGLLKSRPNAGKKELLPEAMDEAFECPGTEKCSQAGDVRVNQHAALTSLHTAFLREHNRIARELSELNPGWSDNRVFFEARKIVGAELQNVAYAEYLPLVLGPDVTSKFDLTIAKSGFFDGYDEDVNPDISNVFATEAYRFGHSLVDNEFDRYPPDFAQNSQCPIKLAFSFFNPSYVLNGDEGGPDSILRGLTAQPSQDFNRFMVSGLTKFLVAEPPESDQGFDLATFDIQRGRDHGLPGYNAWREKCGLPRAPGFDHLASEIPDVTTRQKLESIYSHVDDIDLFVGGLSEQSVPGGIVGPTFACLIGLQFQDLRKGDRFWFENQGQFTEDQLVEIKKTSLARILCDNTDGTTDLQPDVFRQPTQPGNERVACSSLPQMDLKKWQIDAPEQSKL